MKVTVLDREIPGLECFDRGDDSLFGTWLSVFTDRDIVEVYFVNVSDETFKKFGNEGDKRVFVREGEVKKYINMSDYVFIYKNGKLKLCFIRHNLTSSYKVY